jgi:hypothetical protein
MKLDPLLNRRVIFKLHGMDPLAGQLDQSNCSVRDNDVRYLEFTRIEWLRATRQRPASS